MAGKYQLIVRGTNGNGKWSDPPIVIRLNVQEYFYKKWWFYLLVSLPFIAGAMFWIYRQKKMMVQLEEEVVKRTATIRNQAQKLEELDNVKSQLYTNITHEFRTPLTVIAGLASEIEEGEEKNT